MNSTWANIIYKYGIPSALALYLVWHMTTTQAAVLERIDRTTTAHTAATVDSKERENRMESYLRLLCSFSAKTPADRNTCLSVR